MILILLLSLLLVTACGHPKQARVEVPPPPPPESTPAAPAGQPAGSIPATHENPAAVKSDEGADLAEPTIPAGTKPIVTET